MTTRFLRNTSGAAALELALTAPVFFALMAAIIQGCLLMWGQVSLQHGVEAAARCAAINVFDCDTTTKVQAYAVTESLGFDPPTSTFTVSTPACGSRVAASYDFALFFGFFGLSSINLTATSCFPK